MSTPTLTSKELTSERRFVERRYSDGTIDWLWSKFVKPGDIDCTDVSSDELAARIAEAKVNGLKVV